MLFRSEAEKRPIRYDGTWRDRDPAEAPPAVKPVIRFKAPHNGETIIDDRVQGRVVIPNKDLDDLIILRSDGNPTYNLAVVVDDHDMGVTHIIRGVDHLTNAARQMQIYHAMGWRVPEMSHIPLIHGPDGAKLSKRHGALGVEAYRAMGYLPEAMRNYLARLGWSHGDDEIFSTEQAVGMWVTTAAYAAQNPAAVTAFQKSIAEVNRFASTKAGWDKILQSMNPVYTQVDLATARKANPAIYPTTIVANDLKAPADKMLALGFLKKPLDVLETVENKFSGLVAAGAVVPITMGSVANAVLAWQGAPADPLHTGGLAMIQLGASTGGTLLSVLTIPFGVAVFAVVWMASHAINVLILLSPWGAIDAVLKSARTSLLGLVALTATINPWLGALLSAVVIVLAWFVAGWAFRLTIFGSVFCWDFLTGRRGRFRPAENDNRLFAGGNLPGVPPRTYGRLVERSDGRLQFFHRPWLVLAEKSATVPAGSLAVGRGFFFSSIVHDGSDTLFLLPPRYRGHEEELVRVYKLAGGVQPAGLRKAWSLLRELFGGAAAKAQVN